MIIPVQDIGKVGLASDAPAMTLPLNAWTSARNIRFRRNAAEKFSGHVPVFGSPIATPRYLLPAAYGGQSFWMYPSDTKVGATDGTTHADISAGTYTSNPSIGWTGTIIENIPVITNGVDYPQMWRYPALTQALQPLTAWQTGVYCNAIRSLKRYLVALDVTKQGVHFPTMIKWSHEAPTGDVPLSWDETVETLDAGEYTLPGGQEQGGFLIDGFPLRDVLMLYREFETWMMQFIGGIDIFAFRRVFQNVGSLSRRSAVEFFSGQHLVFTGDDVVLHDGQQAQSLLDERIRSEVSGQVDTDNYGNSFVSVDYANTEVYVCFPETGQIYPTKAIVWNWKTNTWGVRALPGAQYIAPGIVQEGNPADIWDNDTQVWDQDHSVWEDRTSDPTKRRLLMASGNQFFALGVGLTFDQTTITATLERTGLGFPTKHPAPPDYSRYKQINGLFPQITGTEGGVVNVYLGTQDKLSSDPIYYGARAFTIGSSEFLDFSGIPASRIHALKFESNTNIAWKLHGYDVDVIDRGSQ